MPLVYTDVDPGIYALAEVNVRGTERLLALTRDLDIGSFAFVGSAYSCGLTWGDIPPDRIEALMRWYSGFAVRLGLWS